MIAADDTTTGRRRRRGVPRSVAMPLLIAAIALAPAMGAAETPRRVVSIHLCADQLLLGLADRAQIVSLSRLARDRLRSFMADRVGDLPTNGGLAEEVIALAPDLVLAGAFSARPGVAVLRRLGYRILDLGVPRSFDDIRRQIRRVAAALGHPARGARLIAEMDRRLAAARPPSGGVRPVAVLYQAHGFAMGADTLEHALLNAAGFDNLAARLGLRGLGHIPLERLVHQAPDLVVFGMAADAPPSLAKQFLAHPALTRVARAMPTVVVAPLLWACGAWYTVAAVERLAQARRSLGQGGGW